MSTDAYVAEQFAAYDPGGSDLFDEMFHAPQQARPASAPLVDYLSGLQQEDLATRQRAAVQAMVQKGITFTVYGDKAGTERIIPFDVLPRIIAAEEWRDLSAGLRQRTEALNHFLADVYGEQKILTDKIIPSDLVLKNPAFRPQMVGLKPPKGVWNHISGTDLIRDANGKVFVLEDNMRCPSGYLTFWKTAN